MSVPVARVTDPVGAHASANLGDTIGLGTAAGVLLGALGGAVIVGAVVLTGGGALVLAGAVMGAISTTAMGAATGLQSDVASANARAKKVGSGCSHITEGSGNVFAEGLAVTAVGHHNDHRGAPKLSDGCRSVFVNGQRVCRVGDPSTCGGKVIAGARTVFVSDGSGAAAEDGGAAPGMFASMGHTIARLFDKELYTSLADGDTQAAIDLLNGISLTAGAAGALASIPATGARLAMTATAGRAVGLGRAAAFGTPAVAATTGAGLVGGEYGSEWLGDIGERHYGEQGRIWLGAAGGVVGGALTGATMHGAQGRVVGSRLAKPVRANAPEVRALRHSDVVARTEQVDVALAEPRRLAVGGDNVALRTPVARSTVGAAPAEPTVAPPRPCPTCTGGGGLGRGGMTPIRGNYSQSQVLARGDMMLKRVRNPGGNPLDRQSRVRLAHRLAEAHNRVSEALGEDVVPRLENVTHDDGRPSQWLAQRRVEGVEYKDLAPEVREHAQAQMQQHIARAREAIGLEESRTRTESGVTYHVDDYNAGNFRFDEHGNVRSWFDPIYMEAADQRPITANEPLRFARSHGEPTTTDAKPLVDDDATVRRPDLVDDDATVRGPMPHPEPNRGVVRDFGNDVWGYPRQQVRLAGRLNVLPQLTNMENLPGVTDVFVHGTPRDGFWIRRRPGTREATALAREGRGMPAWQARLANIGPDGGQFVSPEHLANVLRRLGIEGDVRLVSCEAASLGDVPEATAARFTRAWSRDGERVYAYRTAVGVSSRGHILGSDPRFGPHDIRDPGLTAFDVDAGGRVRASAPENRDIFARAAAGNAAEANRCATCSTADSTSAANIAARASARGLYEGPREAFGPRADEAVIPARRDRFTVRAGELAANDVIVPRHGVTEEQLNGDARVGHGGVRQLPNGDLVRYGGPAGNDPIRAARAYAADDDVNKPGPRIVVEDGHHRLHEIARRVRAGEMSPDTHVEMAVSPDAPVFVTRDQCSDCGLGAAAPPATPSPKK